MGKWGLFGTGLAAGVTAGVGGTYLAQSRTNLSNTTNGTTTDQRTGADTSGQSDKGADQQPPPTPPDVAHLSRRLFNATQDVWEEQRQADTSKAPTPPRHPLQARHLAHPFRRHNPTENTGPAGPSSGNGLSADDEVESGPTASSGDTTTSTVGMKIGYRGQNDSILDLAATAGISLLGPRGVDVARAIAATLIMGGDSRGFGWMVITRAHAVAMLGTLDTTRLPTGIVIVDDLEDAITTMDRQISVRFNAPEHTNWPMTLFILNHPVLDEDTRELLTDFLTDGQTVGVTALILGPDPLGDTITTDLHGTVISTCGDALAHLDGARLFHMPTEGAFPVFSQLTWTTPAPLPETTDTDRDTDEEDEPISTSHTGDVQDAPVANLALTARENDAVADDRASQNGTAQLSRVAVSITAALEPPAHTTPQTAPAAARAPHQPGPAAEPERTEPDETNSTHEDADEPTAGLPSTNRAAAHDTDDDTHDAHQDDAGDDAAIDGHEPSPPPTTTGMLRLEILGGAVALSLVSEHDQAARTPIVIPDGGRIAQYLTHVALERNGIRKEQLAESLWPEAKNPVASLNQTNSELRKTVRKAIGPGYETLMNATSKSCQLNSKLLTVDYWELLDAGTPTQDSATLLLQVARFRATLADYHGALGRGIDAEWIETYREDVRRQAMTTTNNLTDQLIDNDQVSLAIALLHQTRNFAHYNESLYLKIIRLEQQLGRNEAAVNTYKLLEEKLQEIGAEPMKSTENLACGKR